MIVMTILNDEDMGMIVHDSKQGVTAEKMLMFPKEALLLKYFIGFLDFSTKIPMKSDRLHI